MHIYLPVAAIDAANPVPHGEPVTICKSKLTFGGHDPDDIAPGIDDLPFALGVG